MIDASTALRIMEQQQKEIEKLRQLVKLQHEALEKVGRDQWPVVEEAITAYDKIMGEQL